jgi:hypothetical protein
MMTRSATVLLLVAALATGPTLAGCTHTEAPASGEGPATLEEIPGSDVKKVVFTEDATEAIGVETAAVTAGPAAGQLTMPYAAVIYYTDGSTWAYTVAEERSYVRKPVTVASISGDVVTLAAGPEAGTSVVVVGAPEILGAELEIDGEQ